MIQTLRDTGKRSTGWLLSRTVPHYRYPNCLFILAHMRCGSTALSNVLCSRPDVSGYGEAHVTHDSTAAPGLLALNQLRRGGWKPRADCLFDKILHSRHDQSAPPEFFEARAIFLVRRPGDAIHSIVRLFAGLGRAEYQTYEEATQYYVERVTALAALWDRFSGQRRIGFTHETLLASPDRALAAISRQLSFCPPLENRYVSLAASRRGGGGDPLQSGNHTRIQSDPSATGVPDRPLDAPAALVEQAEDAYTKMKSRFAAELGLT